MALATAAYRRCDVLVVNAVADGMNLVAKEAVVVNERDMVLALSEATGAHDELGSFAVTLHPFDVAQQADALHEALTMPRQLRRDRREHAAEVVHRNDVRRWLAQQLPATWRSWPRPDRRVTPRRGGIVTAWRTIGLPAHDRSGAKGAQIPSALVAGHARPLRSRRTLLVGVPHDRPRRLILLLIGPAGRRPRS